MFLIKPKKVVVDCFTVNPSIAEFSPITPMNNHAPEWWKKLPAKVDVQPYGWGFTRPSGTLKVCDGYLAYLKSGFVIPMWADLIVGTRADGAWQANFSGEPLPQVTSHGEQQYGPAFDNFIHLKIGSPWLFREKTGVKFAWFQPMWNQLDLLGKTFIPPAVIDFKYQRTTNVPMFVPKVDTTFTIEQGTPMAHLIPMTEKEVEIKQHVVTEQEYINLHNELGFGFTFLGKYKKVKKAIDAKEKGKCPFGFGSK